MKKVTIKELKQNLSAIAAIAAKGGTVIVTKHNKPYLQLTSLEDPSVHVGKYVGKKSLKPFFKTPKTKGKYLEYLLEDRDDDR